MPMPHFITNITKAVSRKTNNFTKTLKPLILQQSSSRGFFRASAFYLIFCALVIFYDLIIVFNLYICFVIFAQWVGAIISDSLVR
jgi:hypothetical protein